MDHLTFGKKKQHNATVALIEMQMHRPDKDSDRLLTRVNKLTCDLNVERVLSGRVNRA